jgi:hypothetical protein
MDAEQLRTRHRELALDLRWAWNHAADHLWIRLDPELWALTRNAWVILQTVSRERLDACLMGVERKLPPGRNPLIVASSDGSTDGRFHATRSFPTLLVSICASGEYLVDPLSPE